MTSDHNVRTGPSVRILRINMVGANIIRPAPCENMSSCHMRTIILAPNKRGYLHDIFLIYPRKDMLWVLIKTLYL